MVLQHDILQWLDHQQSILVFTDPAATYNNTFVRQLWSIMLFITDGIISIFMVLAVYQVMFAGFTARYSEALEALPNLVFVAISANLSLLFARFWIDLNNMLCSLIIVQAQTQSHPLAGLGTVINNPSVAMITLPLLLVLVILLGILGIQMSGRLGVIVLLIVFLSTLLALLAHHRTRRFGQAGLTSYVTAVLLQFLQLSCITVGGKVLLPFLSATIESADGIASIVALLAGIALLWTTLRLPAILRQWALAPVAESGRAARSLLVATGARLLLV